MSLTERKAEQPFQLTKELPNSETWEDLDALEAVITLAGKEGPNQRLAQKALRVAVSGLESQEDLLTFLENTSIIGLRQEDPKIHSFVFDLLRFATPILGIKDRQQACNFLRAMYSPDDHLAKKFIDISQAHRLIGVLGGIEWSGEVEDIQESIREAYPEVRQELALIERRNPERHKAIIEFYSPKIRGLLFGEISGERARVFPWNLALQDSPLRRWIDLIHLKIMHQQKPSNSFLVKDERDKSLILFEFPREYVPDKKQIERLVGKSKKFSRDLLPGVNRVKLKDRGISVQAFLTRSWGIQESQPNPLLENQENKGWLLGQLGYLALAPYKETAKDLPELARSGNFAKIKNLLSSLYNIFRLDQDLGYREEQREIREIVGGILERLGEVVVREREAETIWEKDELFDCLFMPVLFGNSRINTLVADLARKLEKGSNYERMVVIFENFERVFGEHTDSILKLPEFAKIRNSFKDRPAQTESIFRRLSGGWKLTADDLGLLIRLYFFHEESTGKYKGAWLEIASWIMKRVEEDPAKIAQLILDTLKRATPKTREFLLHLLFEDCQDHQPPHLHFLTARLITEEAVGGNKLAGRVLDEFHQLAKDRKEWEELIRKEGFEDVGMADGLWTKKISLLPPLTASLLRGRERLRGVSDEEILEGMKILQSGRGIVLIAGHKLFPVIFPESLDIEGKQALILSRAKELQEVVNREKRQDQARQQQVRLKREELRIIEESLGRDPMIYRQEEAVLLDEVNPAEEDIFIRPKEELLPQEKLLRTLKEASFAGLLKSKVSDEEQFGLLEQMEENWQKIWGEKAQRMRTLRPDGHLFYLWPEEKKGKLILFPIKQEKGTSDIGGRLIFDSLELYFVIDQHGNLRDKDGLINFLDSANPGFYFQLNHLVVQKAYQELVIKNEILDKRVRKLVMRQMDRLDQLDAHQLLEQGKMWEVEKLFPQLGRKKVAHYRDIIRIRYLEEYRERRLLAEERSRLYSQDILWIIEDVPMSKDEVEEIYGRAKRGSQILDDPVWGYPRVLGLTRHGEPMLPSRNVLERLTEKLPNIRLPKRIVHFIGADGGERELTLYSTFVGRKSKKSSRVWRSAESAPFHLTS